MVTDELVTNQARDLLEEVAAKNHVAVRVFRTISKPRSAYAIQKQVMHELGETVAQLPALVRQDHLRMLKGLKPIYVGELNRRFGGELVSVTGNLRTNVGIDFVADSLSGPSGAGGVADYIGLSANAATPAAGDSSSSVPWSSAQTTDGTGGEFTMLGLARKQATYAHTGSATSYTMTATWTASATVTNVRLAGLFGGSSKTTQGNSANNKLVLENTFTATTLANTDQLSLTWTVNI